MHSLLARLWTGHLYVWDDLLTMSHLESAIRRDELALQKFILPVVW